ncbi:hypothetical protein ACN38_g5049 [Penicillium nordicum]|uniref:Uncharacterized protein n=1 Tax=Penicillium nordicum TaxID=229535 RepID=A0A0M9WGL2_9EURO|nr:hypothetical protein ACN38_g5049 [Penicillium nordicum]
MDAPKAPELLVLPQLSILIPKTGLLIGLAPHIATIDTHNIRCTSSQDPDRPHRATCSTVTITSKVDSPSSCLSYTTNMEALFGRRLQSISPIRSFVIYISIDTR